MAEAVKIKLHAGIARSRSQIHNKLRPDLYCLLLVLFRFFSCSWIGGFCVEVFFFFFVGFVGGVFCC